MVKHIILWKLKDEMADKDSVAAGIKAVLEGLKGVVSGLVDIAVNCILCRMFMFRYNVR